MLSFSLHHRAAAEEKGKQMSDIPSAALFSDPAHPACRESLLQNQDNSGCKLIIGLIGHGSCMSVWSGP